MAQSCFLRSWSVEKSDSSPRDWELQYEKGSGKAALKICVSSFPELAGPSHKWDESNSTARYSISNPEDSGSFSRCRMSALLAKELRSVDPQHHWSHRGCGTLTAGGADSEPWKTTSGSGRLWVKLEEKRGTGLPATLRVTQEATAGSAPPCVCDCRITCTCHIKEYIIFLLHVSDELQKLDESMRYQAQSMVPGRGWVEGSHLTCASLMLDYQH